MTQPTEVTVKPCQVYRLLSDKGITFPIEPADIYSVKLEFSEEHRSIVTATIETLSGSKFYASVDQGQDGDSTITSGLLQRALVLFGKETNKVAADHTFEFYSGLEETRCFITGPEVVAYRQATEA